MSRVWGPVANINDLGRVRASSSWPWWPGLAQCLGRWWCWGVPWMRWKMPGQAKLRAGQGTFHSTGTALGKDQGVGMKAHTEVSHSFSRFSCFHSVWSKITGAFYQGWPKGRGDRVCWRGPRATVAYMRMFGCGVIQKPKMRVAQEVCWEHLH